MPENPTLADRVEAMCRTAGHCNRPPCDLAAEVRALEAKVAESHGDDCCCHNYERFDCREHEHPYIDPRCIEWRKP